MSVVRGGFRAKDGVLTGTFALAAGRTTLPALQAAANAAMIDVSRGGSCRLEPIGQGADNGTFDYRVWGFIEDDDRPTNVPLGGVLVCLGSGSATLCTAVGAAGGQATASDRSVDTLTWAISTAATTPAGPMDKSELGFNEGTSFVYSPGANLPGYLHLPHTARCSHLIFEVSNLGAGCTGANVIASVGI